MSAAPAAVAGAVAPPAKGGKKKLIVIIALVLLLVIGGGVAALLIMKKKAHAAEEGEDAPVAEASAHDSGKPDLKHPPAFLPLDPFVVNLADKEVDRYAQVGITLEVEDPKFAEQMKAFMPAIRNGILMILAHKNSRELLDRAGKEQLASEILRESARTMGIEVEDPQAIEDEHAADDKGKAKKKKKKPAPPPNPIKHVHFSNFIVQ